MNTFELSIEGMTCGHCISAVQSTLGDLSGVEVEAVAIGSARGQFDPEKHTVEELASAVSEEGYSARPVAQR